MQLKSRRKFGFAVNPLHRKREPHAFHYLKQRVSFWIASFSLVAFVAGNMVGQHGWYAFWKSVLGGMDDSLIVYIGTVAPVEKVPDYERWALYGGNSEQHTFRQVPQDVLIPLPRYSSVTQRREDLPHGRGNDVYSVGYLGSYVTGVEGTGSHPGVDIRMPIGTPVLAMASGFVYQVKEGGGFGKVVVLRHPNVPDPVAPGKTSTIYSLYAHLNSIYVSEGDIVYKGEHIADSGMTGLASGPHLHFQIDRDEAPWHPYWPFTDREASREGMSFNDAVNSGLFQSRGYLYTVNPMLYAQANFAPVEMTVAQAKNEPAVSESAVSKNPVEAGRVLTFQERLAQRLARMLARREERLRERLERRGITLVASATQQEPVAPAVKEASAPEEKVLVEKEQVVVSAQEVASASISAEEVQKEVSSEVEAVKIRHDGSYSGREWERVTFTIVDGAGKPVANPGLMSDLHLRTAYGDAEFRPAAISPLDFVEGQATVSMLPRGRKTIVIQVQPYGVMSEPMVYEQR